MAVLTNGLNHGEVFTRRWVVEAILDLVGYTTDRDLAAMTALEPSVGSGAFWEVMVERLLVSAFREGHAPDALTSALRGFDLQQAHRDYCAAITLNRLTEAGVSEPHSQRLVRHWLKTGDYLLDSEQIKADFVVGNPPYIRWDDLEDSAAAEYRRKFQTMRGRADIYVAFFERGLSQLKPGGTLGYICADRWMRNAYGGQLRELIGAGYSVDTIWSMHGVDAFEAEVDAYPAITVLSNQPQGSTVVAECGAQFDAHDSLHLANFTRGAGAAKREHNFRAHRVDSWFKGTDLWPAGDPDRIAMLESLAERLPTLEDAGVKVGIGIATGADKAYIVDQSTVVEDNRKLPLIMSNDVRSGSFTWGGKVLLNPWDENGKLVDLEEYPLLAALYANQPKLRDRYVARNNPSSWFKTIDRVNYSILNEPKLLLQGMKAALTPVLEEGGHYPHHNLYVLTSPHWDLRVLGGLLMSDVAQAFIEAYGVRMRGGTLRFQSQYLRKIRVPNLGDISEALARSLAVAFDSGDRVEASRLARIVYGLDDEL
jgi:adenine-specific DNA-methyltransferase